MTIKDPHSYADLTQGKISHIDFKISVDFPTRLLSIKAGYQLDQPVTGSFYLDTNGLDIESIESDGTELDWELDESDPVLGQRLHIKELDGVTTFSATFMTSDEASALQWTSPVQTAGGAHPFLYSQCQAINARSLFPCQDTPAVRFTYTASLDVPKPLVGVMAAEFLGVEEGDDNRIYRFEIPQPIPSYLFALAVGNLVFRETGPNTGIYAEPETIEAAVWEFAENEAKLAKAEKLLGPYKWGRYDLLIMPPSFPYGGMENPRLTFVSPTVITGKRDLAIVITHELAHAWTGNLVTNATWEHFWLNEGWTTYAQYRINEVLEGEERTTLAVADAVRYLELLIERLGSDSEATRLRVNAEGKNLYELLTEVHYYKGMSFLRALEKVVGRNRFDRFIQTYIERYQFQSLTTEEFIAFLDQELPEVRDQVNIQNWLYDTGLPQAEYHVQSDLYDQMKTVLETYRQGTLPGEEQIAGWSTNQRIGFLRDLPDDLSAEDCIYFDNLFELSTSKNASEMSAFYSKCILSGYQEILPRVEALVAHVGRGLYIMPVYRALIQSEWSKPQARRIFEEVRKRYHPVMEKIADGLLSEAGL